MIRHLPSSKARHAADDLSESRRISREQIAAIIQNDIKSCKKLIKCSEFALMLAKF
jgi:hypothetical protein